MGLPGQRRSKSSKRRRAAHFALHRQALVVCTKCGKMTLPHTACPRCGTYRGRVVIETASTRRVKRVQRHQRQQPRPTA